MKEVLTVALPKGRIQKDTMNLLNQIGISCPEMEGDSRKLIFDLPEKNMRFMVVRATDVPTYVEHGAADIGVVGKDTLMEQGKDLYEPLDLKIGYCRMIVAEAEELKKRDKPYPPPGWTPRGWVGLALRDDEDFVVDYSFYRCFYCRGAICGASQHILPYEGDGIDSKRHWS